MFLVWLPKLTKSAKFRGHMCCKYSVMLKKPFLHINEETLALSHLSGNITASYPTATSKNQGLINSSAQFEGGKKVKIYTRLHVNICHQDLYLLNGCKLDIRLHPNPNQFILVSANDVDGYHLKIHSCELIVCYVDIHTSTILAQQQLLQSGVNARYSV